ncbi:MAG: carboxypeptidase-like regulatory domain-containing protein [Gammaproteobacteria bacterium]|nr:carboxypeptidase-like regulatory domain-containing protein [Gammaproteobacteria bacterium]
MRPRWSNLILLLLLIGAADAATISGQVVDALSRQPLQDVEIHLTWYGGERLLDNATDAEGRFEYPLSEVLPAVAHLRRSLNLRFSQPGYIAESLLLERSPEDVFQLTRKRIELSPISGLSAPISGNHSTLYVLPYRVTRGSTLSDPEQMQILITEYLTSGVDIYLQEIAEPVPIESFGLQRLEMDTPLEISNTSQVIDYGYRLKNALAIVGGRAGTRLTDDQREQMAFNSRYVIVPGIEGQTGRVMRWDDILPTGLISSRAIADRLNRLWGRNTVLAIALATYQRAMEADALTAQQLLAKAEAFLKAELSDAGSDEPLVAELDGLLQRVKEARKP